MAKTLSEFATNIAAKITPQGGADVVTAQEIRDVLDVVKTLFQERGLIILSATSELANTASTESTWVFVEGAGLFQYSATGTPDNVNSFPAQNGGRWVRKLSDQTLSTELSTIAALTPADNNFLQRKSGAWTSRTPAQAKADMALDQVPNIDPRNPANITQDATHRFVTDTEKSTWNAKQNQLVSGQNIKTINGQPIVGAGDVVVSPEGSITTDPSPAQGSTNPVQSGGAYTALSSKKDKITKTKTAHGFSLGWAVVFKSGAWQRANGATNGDDRKTVGIVISVPDANTFVIGQPGDIISGLSGLTVGAPYYLATTTTNTANYTTTEPSVVGQWSKILFVAISATEAVIVNEYGYEIADPATSLTVADGAITNAKLASDVKVGSLASLITAAKSNVVAAINELKAAINGLTSGSGGADKDYISLPPLTAPGTFAAASASASQINLTWTDITGEVNYIIQRSTSPNSGFSTIYSPAAGSTSQGDTGLPASTTFYYRAKAVGDGWTTRDSQWVYANATTDAGGGGATVEQEILLNFLNEFRDPNEYAGVQGINDVGGTSVSGGTASISNVKDINDVATTVDFALTSAGITVSGAPGNGSDPSSNTVFGKEFIAGLSWYLANGGTFRISGLAPTRTYKLYFWSNSFGWESAVVNFTANGVTTSNVTTGNNFGDSAGDPLLDGALRQIDVISDASGNIDVTCNNVSGYNAVPLTALYIQRMSA